MVEAKMITPTGHHWPRRHKDYSAESSGKRKDKSRRTKNKMAFYRVILFLRKQACKCRGRYTANSVMEGRKHIPDRNKDTGHDSKHILSSQKHFLWRVISGKE